MLNESKLKKCLRKYNPKTLDQLLERFDITTQAFENNPAYQAMAKKVMDDERYIGELKATIGELVTERTRLKLKVNGLLSLALQNNGKVLNK